MKKPAVSTSSSPSPVGKLMKLMVFLLLLLCAGACLAVVVYAKMVDPPWTVGGVITTVIENGGGFDMSSWGGTARVAVAADGSTKLDPCANRLCEDNARL